MHIVGGYGEGASTAPTTMSTTRRRPLVQAAPLPRGANHVAVVADAGRVYALGGFIEQNRNPDPNAYAYDVAADRWTAIAPLPRPRGAAAAVALDGQIHLIGGAGAPTKERASVGWHEVYDPQTDQWNTARRCPARATMSGPSPITAGSISSAAASTPSNTTPIFTTSTCRRATHGGARAAADRAFRPRPGGLPRPLLRDGRRRWRAGQRADLARRRIRPDGELRSRDEHLAGQRRCRRRGTRWGPPPSAMPSTSPAAVP